MSSQSVTTYLSKEEIQSLLKVSDYHGLKAIVTDWGLIALCMAGVALWPAFYTIIPAVFIIGGRQLGLAILMHEACHGTLFTNKKINDFVGEWLCSIPLWLSLSGYRKHHLQHHKYTWTENDPDLGLSNIYPVSKKSFARKMLRDLFGLTALKAIYGFLLRDFGYMEFTISNKITWIDQTGRTKSDVIKTGIKNLAPFVLVQGFFLGILFLLHHPGLYLLWWAAFLSPFQLFIRLRAIAEHAVIGDPNDDFQNTRTTEAFFHTRLFIAPHRVNYHLEHHLLMTVPHHLLPVMHQKLKAQNVFNSGNWAEGYGAVYQKAMI